MDSLIRETNENLKAIIDTMKSNLDTYTSNLDNIQLQMDKKVEEAKKYKIQVDNAKERIKEYEESNKSLELSLKELNDKYGKMNLVSLVETGNREIKTKINDNNIEIAKEKEHIAELTNKARTIKDLLINLKKDKNIKEERLENIKIVYKYYSERINEIIDYAFDHSENLNDYVISYNKEFVEPIINNTELENTMIFDEIANIDDNKLFKDEMTFINDQIENDVINNDKIQDLIKSDINNKIESEVYDQEESSMESIEKTEEVFDSILNNESNDNSSAIDIEKEIESEEINNLNVVMADTDISSNFTENKDVNVGLNTEEDIITEQINNNEMENLTQIEIDNKEEHKDILNPINNLESELLNITNKLNDSEDSALIEKDNFEDSEEDLEEERINKINDLFNSIDNTKTSNINLNNINQISGIENSINAAYLDVFGKPIEEKDLNKKESTLTDIFGNPIIKEETKEEKKSKKIEELFLENEIDFKKFKENEQNYLKQVYDEEKFQNIFNTLKRNKINLDNVYEAFNIFGEISPNELEGLISKLINCGQSIESIGLVLEKLPKVKKYNLSDAIISYGDYIKNIDITELIMKAKDLYNGGNN